MKSVSFFYDESAHSRKLTTNTVNDDRFEPYFCTTIFGIENEKLETFKNDYLIFENKWKEKYTLNSELKSTIIKQKKFKLGTKSMKDMDVEFYLDFFDLLLRYKDYCYLHFGLISKIEFLIRQLDIEFGQSNDGIINRNAAYYVLAKAFSVYHPDLVMNDIINQSEDVMKSIKVFLQKRRELNKRTFGQQEDEAFDCLESCINNIISSVNLDWNYRHSFIGLKKFVYENDIEEFELFLDKEGNGNTLEAAKDAGIKSVSEIDSKVCVGVRCADILSGFINNFVNSFNSYLYYNENEEGKDIRLLPREWFDIDESRFTLYKMAFKTIINISPCFNKTTTLSYCDGLIYLNSFLNYFNEFDNYIEYKNIDAPNHQRNQNESAILLVNYFYKTSLENSFLCIDEEDLSFQLLYDLNDKNLNNDFRVSKKFTLPAEGEYVTYVFLDLLLKTILKNNHKQNERYIKTSTSGEDVFYKCPKELYAWFDEKINMNYLFPKMIFLSKKDGRLYLMPYDPDDDVLNGMKNAFSSKFCIYSK